MFIVSLFSPKVKTVRRRGRGESGGTILPRRARHQDGRPGLPTAVLQREKSTQTASYDSASEERWSCHPGSLHPPAVFHTEGTGGREDVLSGNKTLYVSID